MELKPPMVSFSKPDMEPLLSRMNMSSVKFFFMVKYLLFLFDNISISKAVGLMVALKATNQPPKRGWSYLNNTSLISKMLYFPLTMKYSTMTSNLLA